MQLIRLVRTGICSTTQHTKGVPQPAHPSTHNLLKGRAMQGCMYMAMKLHRIGGQ